MNRASTAPHLLVMAAGTGGHIIPGLAVAREMLARGWTVSWLGTARGMENRLVPAQGIALDVVAFSGMRGKGLLGNMTGALRMVQAFWQCLHIIRSRKPRAVLGMGGYVCFPGGWVAGLLRLPLMLVNADASLLLSNKALLPVAARVGFGFDGEAARAVRHGVVTGNPVRAEIEAMPAPEERFAGRSGPLRVLLVGGSLGARALNEALPAALASMAEHERPQVTHQTGEANLDSVRAAYERAGLEAEVLPFIDDMARRLAECDVIVCRAGAVTVSELCAGGVPGVLVPLVVSTTSHQRDNAQWMSRHDAAIHLPQSELTPQRLAETLRGLTRDKLLAMARRARSLAQPRSAQRVADEIERIALKGAAA